VFIGNLNLKGAKNWLMNLEELLQAMDNIKERKVKYMAYNYSGEARRWCCSKKDSLVKELRSDKGITWTRLYSLSLRIDDDTSRITVRKEEERLCYRCAKLHFGKCKLGINWCYRCGKTKHFVRNCNQLNRNGNSLPGWK
jgi:hypothetical protein